jgi:hypothetical protein
MAFVYVLLIDWHEKLKKVTLSSASGQHPEPCDGWRTAALFLERADYANERLPPDDFSNFGAISQHNVYRPGELL